VDTWFNPDHQIDDCPPDVSVLFYDKVVAYEHVKRLAEKRGYRVSVYTIEAIPRVDQTYYISRGDHFALVKAYASETEYALACAETKLHPDELFEVQQQAVRAARRDG
jgi:hypothetical protein